MKKVVCVLIISLVIPAFAGATVQDLQVSNNTSAAVTISWITDSDNVGEVHYSKNSNLSAPLTAYDTRGQAFEGYTHYVEIKNLEKETTYYFEVVSGGEIDNNDGYYYIFKTMKEPSTPPGICLLYGHVYQADGTTAAEGAIVHLWLTHGGADSYLLSKLIDSKGSFLINIKEARSTDTDNLFSSIATGDPVHLKAVYDVNRSGDKDVIFEGCTRNCGSLTLVYSPSITTTSTTAPSTVPTTAPTTTPTTAPTTPPQTSTTTPPQTSTTIPPISTTTTIQSTTTTKIPLPEYEVTITPSSVNVSPLETLQFNASTTRDGELVVGTYRWYVDSTKGSSIDENGLYRAGAVAETGTVLVIDIDHGDITTTAVVTVSPLWLLAYEELWGVDKERKLSLLRSFRDEIITNDDLGRDYLFLLYSNSVEIATLLIQYPSILAEAGRVIDELLPGVQARLEGKKMSLSGEQAAHIESLLNHLEVKTSPQLKKAIKKVRGDLREGILFKQFGFTGSTRIKNEE